MDDGAGFVYKHIKHEDDTDFIALQKLAAAIARTLCNSGYKLSVHVGALEKDCGP